MQGFHFNEDCYEPDLRRHVHEKWRKEEMCECGPKELCEICVNRKIASAGGRARPSDPLISIVSPINYYVSISLGRRNLDFGFYRHDDSTTMMGALETLIGSCARTRPAQEHLNVALWRLFGGRVARSDVGLLRLYPTSVAMISRKLPRLSLTHAQVRYRLEKVATEVCAVRRAIDSGAVMYNLRDVRRVSSLVRGPLHDAIRVLKAAGEYGPQRADQALTSLRQTRKESFVQQLTSISAAIRRSELLAIDRIHEQFASLITRARLIDAIPIEASRIDRGRVALVKAFQSEYWRVMRIIDERIRGLEEDQQRVLRQLWAGYVRRAVELGGWPVQ